MKLAVCSWSLQPKDSKDLCEKLKAVGVRNVQLALTPILKNPEAWKTVVEDLRAIGVEVMSTMVESEGEDYTTLESIRKTGGIVPDETWEQNLAHISQAITYTGKTLKVKLLTFHAGFIPHDVTSPVYAKLSGRIKELAAIAAKEGVILCLETGQEEAPHLKEFLESLNDENVRINFDPANVILYDNGDPIEAIKTLAPYIVQCHLKDATRTKVPGTWGAEVTVGTGEVDWKQFFATLKSIGYKGDFSLEREAGDQRIIDLKAGKVLAQSCIPELS